MSISSASYCEINILENNTHGSTYTLVIALKFQYNTEFVMIASGIIFADLKTSQHVIEI